MVEVENELRDVGHIDLTQSALEAFAAGLEDLNDIKLTGLSKEGRTVAQVEGFDSTSWLVSLPHVGPKK
jgi:hypothetical protein